MGVMPWWGWVLVVALGVVMAGVRAAKKWRASLRHEFIEYLRREAPDVDVVREGDRELELRTPDGGQSTLRLDRLFAAATKLASDDGAEKEALFSQFLHLIREGRESSMLDAARDRDRVLPRLVNERFLQRLRGEAKEGSLPALPSGVSGLFVVFVLDGKNSVTYLTSEHLGDLKLTEQEALSLAKQNLSRSFDKETVRRAVGDGSINVMKALDTFDAARLLLVPECLGEGESLAALIPDRDTLVLTRAPADGNWGRLRKLAGVAAGEPLWAAPLLVTRSGIASCP